MTADSEEELFEALHRVSDELSRTLTALVDQVEELIKISKQLEEVVLLLTREER